MTYKYEGWNLYKIDVKFKGSTGTHTMYFFSKKTPKRGIMCDMPDGYEVGVNKKTGLPYLKYSGNRESLYKRKKNKK